MSLHVYDHVTRKRRKFEPVNPGNVGMYVCGMTVQDKPHVGHMFAFVACDMIRRYLEYSGYKVKHIQNFTDIDDKIIARAEQEGVDYRVVAERNMDLYYKYADALMIRPAHLYPLATEHIPEIIEFIESLIDKGHAYATEGDVYFGVRTDDTYGRLSGRNVDDMRSGVRIEVGDKKRDPLDFALWKAAREGEPSWDSPWGSGRPGWHIECSAMSRKYLGDHFDFHGGGRDLLFPHHENEVAQSCCHSGQDFVNFWLHNGLLYLGDKKMSKSDGNFFAIGDVLELFEAEVIRFFLLSAHFRSQLDYSDERLREAEAALNRLRRGVRALLEKLDSPVEDVPEGMISEAGEILSRSVQRQRERFFAAMDDDFNSGGAIGVLFALVRDINQYIAAAGENTVDRQPLEDAKRLFEEGDTVLGLFAGGLDSCVKRGDAIPDDILALVREREEARAARDWSRADSIRGEIEGRGFEVEDSSSGTTVRPAG